MVGYNGELSFEQFFSKAMKVVLMVPDNSFSRAIGETFEVERMLKNVFKIINDRDCLMYWMKESYK